jgi:hypothetical protein
MAQLEYGDYYKFVASAGIALLAAAVLLPWMFLRESFDLAMETSKLALLTPDAQNVIRERQHLVALIITWIPKISLGIGSVGVAMTTLGLFKWHQRQSIRDRGEELGVEKLSRELQQMSPEEVNAKAREELESTDEELLPVSSADSASPVTTYLAVESALLQRIRECFGSSAKLIYNQRLADVEYDAILRVRESERVILEIKYIRKGFRQGWLTESVNGLAAKTALYSKTVGHRARGVLLIILANSEQSLTDRVKELGGRVFTSQPERFKNLRIRTIQQSAIATIPCGELKALLES